MPPPHVNFGITNAKKGSFNSLPVELLLEIIPYIPYSPRDLGHLCLTCSRVNSVVKRHENSLTRDITRSQFSRLKHDLFPGLCTKDFAGLRILHNRLRALDDIHPFWLQIVHHGHDLDWLKGRWEHVHKAGFLLLYRLHDAGPLHDDRVALLRALPPPSLACLLFKLISSVRILRVHGPEPINAAYARDDMAVRSDVELAFEELLLLHGPEFFVATLQAGRQEKPDAEKSRSEWAVWTLESEFHGMEARQLPLADGSPRPPTLISTLRRSLADQTGIEIGEAVGKMWEILSATGFDNIGGEGVVGKLVRGEGIEMGMKRIF